MTHTQSLRIFQSLAVAFLYFYLHDVMDRAHQEVSQLQFLAPWVLVTPLQNVIKDGDKECDLRIIEVYLISLKIK